MSSDTQNPSIETFVAQMLEQRIADLHTALPARIVRYDAQKQQADVEPYIQRKYLNGQVVTLPVISNVPVVHPRSGDSIIHVPVKVDDTVLLVFAERSVDRWLDSGGVTDPGDPRKHSLSDAFAIPGGYSFNKALPVADPDAITLAGTVRLGENGNATHPAARGDNVEARLSALESGLSQLVTDFTTFITLYSAHVHLETLPPATPTSPPVAPGVPPTPFVADTSIVESAKVKVD